MDLNRKKPEFNGYILPSNGSEKEIVTLIISELIKNGSLTELQIRNLSTTNILESIK